MKVWRYENDQGHGPYGGARSERVKAMGNSRDHNSPTHPGPRADFGSFPTDRKRDARPVTCPRAMRLSQAADYIELRTHGLRPRPYITERIMIVLGGNLLAYVIMPRLERIGTMRQQQITKQPQKRRSERESDPDRKARRDTRAEHSRRSAAFLRRLDGGN